MTETLFHSQSLKYLLSGPLEKMFANPFSIGCPHITQLLLVVAFINSSAIDCFGL